MSLGSRPAQERAFERRYRRHVGDVYHYALGVLRDPLDAEEVTHTTFLNAYRAFRRSGGPPPRLNALLAIAHDVCRIRGGYKRIVEADLVEDELTSAAYIWRALSRLPFDQRAVLVMREVEGRSYAEIGEILTLSVAAVETLIFRARRSLRKELEGSLTCHEAELAVSRELDDRLSRRERRLLHRHLRACEECHDFARSQRLQRDAIRALAAIPLPETLESFFGTRRVRFRLRVAARITAIAGTAALVVALLSAGALPPLKSFVGMEHEPEADAGIVESNQPDRKFSQPATSP
jgi:DNA-directed RNA polymerase specialized sigma24 family protein